MNHTPASPCKRPGCNFPRVVTRQWYGKYRRRAHCSAECRVWIVRASRADRNGDGAEAVELLRLSRLLDARNTPMERVPDVFTDTHS